MTKNFFVVLILMGLGLPAKAGYFVDGSTGKPIVTNEFVEKSDKKNNLETSGYIAANFEECKNLSASDWHEDGNLKNVVRITKNNLKNIIGLELNKGWELVYAKSATGANLYKGKLNDIHEITPLKTVIDYPIVVKISNLKSEKSVLKFFPPSACLREANSTSISNVAKEKNQPTINVLKDIVANVLVPVQVKPEITAVVPIDLLKISKGDRISDVTNRVLGYFGYTLAWRAKDMSFDIDLQIPSADAADVETYLKSVVDGAGYKFMIHNDNINRVVVVTE